MIKAEFELWKDVEGFEGYYQVSTWARVRSLDRWVVYPNKSKRLIKGKILKPFKDKDGYLIVNLKKHQKGKYTRVHRIIAEAFIPNPLNLQCINHKDEVRDNNYPCNLEWCSVKYNNNYGNHNKNVAEKLSKKVYQYDLNGNLIKEWSSASEAGRNGFESSNISMCCLNKYKTHKNYIWSYNPIENFDINNYLPKSQINRKGSKKVYQYDKDYNLINVWASTKECGRNNYQQASVQRCCVGKQKFHKGYIWSYTEINQELV